MTPAEQLVLGSESVVSRIAKHTAGRTGSGVASLLGLLNTTPSKVVSAGVHDNGAL
jgi:hypothetical protein